MIKKLFCAIMVGVLFFSMAACGPKAPADDANGNGDVEESNNGGVEDPPGQEGLLDE